MNQALMDKTITTSSYVASLSTALGGFLSLSNVALLIGILCTLVLFVIQYRMYKRKTKQDQEYHEARMKALETGPS